MTFYAQCCCGCGERASTMHHVVKRQDLRRLAGDNDVFFDRLVCDGRNLVALANGCHERHHSRARPIALTVLPDAVFVFAAQMLGVGRAFNYLGRHYAGDDPRLDALLEGVSSG